MLEIVMTVPLDLGRLKNAGVSEEGIDFVSKMLVINPAGRSTETELLKHPWIAKLGRGDDNEVRMQCGAGRLDSIDEDGDELDASQLSLADKPLHGAIDDSEEELTTDVEEIEGGRQSKRFKTDHSDDHLQAFGGSSDDHVLYPVLPVLATDSVYSEPVAPPPTAQRLFGEIGESALRSSGVLGNNAHAALQVPTERSHDESFDTSESWIDDARMISDEGEPPAIRHSPLRSIPLYTGSARSLFGTEALVGQLNMGSLESDASAPSSASTFEIPRTPKSRDPSLAPAGSVGDPKGLSQVSKSVTDQTDPKQQQQNGSEPRSLRHSVVGSLKHHRSQGSAFGGGSENSKSEVCKPGKTSSPPLATAKGEEKTSVKGGKARLALNGTKEANMQAKGNTLVSHHEILAEDHPSASNSCSSSGPVARETASPISFPKPPTRFGTLTALPGSLCNTIIRLERRITYYGRDPASHVRHADPKEQRIPKNALDIIFWRPGIEAMIQNGSDWSTMDDLYAIVHTRTSRNIKVNGVKLTKGQGCWNYGRLHTGDVITIFGPPEGEQAEGKAAEFLKFRCEFFIGLSAKPRDKDAARFVVEKEEEKYMQNQVRRSMTHTSEEST
jgi:hypothetical protein